MQTTTDVLAQLSDRGLIDEVKRLAGHERDATARLVASLAELDTRRLYLAEGCPSLFAYATRVLGLSEQAAYHRIEAARAARRFPVILERLAAGTLTLTAVTVLAPHLTPENHVSVLDAAANRSKREIELLVARLSPRSDVPALVRKLPAPRGTIATAAVPPDRSEEAPGHDDPTDARGLAARHAEAGPDVRDPGQPGKVADAGGTPPPPGFELLSAAESVTASASACLVRPRPRGPSGVVAPLAPGRHKLQVTIGDETRAKLERCQALLRHAVPDGDLAVVVDRALTLLVEQLERTKAAALKRGRGRNPPRWAARTANEAGRVRVPERAQRASDRARTGVDRTPRSDPRTDSEPANDARTSRSTPEPAAPPFDPRLCPAALQPGGTIATRCPRRTSSPPARARRRSRHIPAAVRRQVWTRDGGRCSYVGPEGRCDATTLLEYHHVWPFARGGRSTVSNVALVCRGHNSCAARRAFGAARPPETTTPAASAARGTRPGPSST